MLLKLNLHKRMKVMRVVVQASTSPPLSAGRAPWVYHVSTMEELSFDPAYFGQSPTIPEHQEEHLSWGCRCCSFTHCQLVFTRSDDESPVRPSRWCHQHSCTNARSPVCRRAELSSPMHHNLPHNYTKHSFPQILIMLHGMMIQLPPRKTSQQHCWVM